MTQRVFNLNAGPAVLPEEVIRRAQEALWSLGSSGIGILEQSHRSREFTAILEAAEENCRELASIPDSHCVLFLQGGASTQFFMLPMNFLTPESTADYIDTGSWSAKAIDEARKFGRVHVAGSSREQNYSAIPGRESLHFSARPAYVHFTSNNTIFGTQWRREPEVPAGVPLFCDASSDLFSRPVDIGKYACLYGGAQKNLGPAGVTLVIMEKRLADRSPESLPTMLRYATHHEHGSLYNTPPVFAIYVLGEVVKGLKAMGGLAAVAEYNEAKAAIIYDFLDQSEFFRPTVHGDHRSLMNICFRAPTPELEAEFVTEASKRGLAGLKGHRSVGGMRASIYNAFPSKGCEKLVDFMKEFERSHR